MAQHSLLYDPCGAALADGDREYVLPLQLALPLILVLSLSLWVVIWKCATWAYVLAAGLVC